MGAGLGVKVEGGGPTEGRHTPFALAAALLVT